MKLAFQIAYRNLVGAGLRTWLNVSVLAFSFIVILFVNGLLDGWNLQARTDSINWDFGNGHLLHANYDPFDPFSLEDGHGVYTGNKEHLNPIFIRQAAIYPEGRMLGLVIKGIEPEQKILELPTALLAKSIAAIPALISKDLSKTSNLKEGDEVLLRWRDKNGTFDAANVTIAGVYKSNVPTVNKGQIWIPIKKLYEMTGLEGHVSLFVADNDYVYSKEDENWKFKTQETLMKPFNDLMSMEKTNSSIIYILLLGIALLALFDTQVLSVFRRQKEIGTYIALGMMPRQVVALFTVEGSMYSIFAMVVGAVISLPLFYYLSITGIALPNIEETRDMGIVMADVVYPVFGLKLIIGSILLMVIAATVVSFLPARKISKMNPVDAIKGKLQ